MKKEESFCPFCKSCELKCTVGKNELACVLMSSPRLTFGHLLVVPKRHVVRPWELSDDEMMNIWWLIKKYQKLLSERVGEGCDVRENFRPFLKQGRLKVDHLHWHLIPRVNKDEIYEKSQFGERELFRDAEENEKVKLEELLMRR